MRRTTERGGALAAVLAALAVTVILAVAAAVGAAVFVARHVEISETRNGTLVETPFGSVRVRKGGALDPKRFGLPVYPGAVRHDDGHKLASVELDFAGTHKEISVLAAEYTTPDPVEKVAAFYRECLPGWKQSSRRHRVHLEWHGEGEKRAVSIAERRGRTHITLASVGDPLSN